ncbi:flavodoxin domain-containing protein [Leucobacter sp. Z1108]|uniref:flavodoxin domain-containing protein n=1 Tax=Leucobacter sp. Z1108 TaxID=3439066 RepID=UPI003F315F39
MKFVFLYGTESGNSEMVAEDLRLALNAEHESELSDLRDYPVSELDLGAFYVIVCSTYGEGDLPNSAVPFAEKLVEVSPDLTGLRYAMFGLGDTFYEETYSQGSEALDRLLRSLGALRVGEYGRHDASTWEAPSDVALAWFPPVVEAALSENVSV